MALLSNRETALSLLSFIYCMGAMPNCVWNTAAHIRTGPMPVWVKAILDDWLSAADIMQGKLFRCVSRAGAVWGTKVTEKVVWHVVKEYATRLGISKRAPHHLRRPYARFCHDSGGELEQIQFLLGHVSVQTTEKYYAQRMVM
jgi:site-specific recombinase XerC